MDNRPALLAQHNATYAVMDEAIHLFHRMKAIAEQLHGGGEMSAGKRGILRDLARLGPKTVPQLARMRPVTRQHIQSLVDPMAAQGLVAFQHNPDHKRSRLVAITDEGLALVQEMFEREEQLFALLGIELDERDLETAARTIRTIRETLASPEAAAAIESIKRDEVVMEVGE